ncbi:MAG TPA: hypothetical protein VKP65_11900, partial [Rhodothermales bacterium]|nr:hypothetical protein [Rhodothermales bacterium]
IREVYDLSEDDVYPIADVMFYHADTMRSWNLQGVDWILFDAEMQKVRQALPVFPPHDLCVCPVEKNNKADCPEDTDG